MRLLFGTRSLGVGCGRREELVTPHEEEMVVACPELLLPAPATSPTYCCLPQLLHAAADDLPDLQLPFEVVLSMLREQGAHSEARYRGAIDCIRKVNHGEVLTVFYLNAPQICCGQLLLITFTMVELFHRFLLLDLCPPEVKQHTQLLKH